MVQTGGVGQDGQVEVCAHHRGQAQDTIGQLGETGQAPADDVPDALGNSHVLDRETRRPTPIPPVDDAGLGEMTEDLPHEEGIALRLLVDRPGELHVLLVQHVPGRLLHVGGDARGIKAEERHALHATVPAKTKGPNGTLVGTLTMWEKTTASTAACSRGTATAQRTPSEARLYRT